MMSWENHRTHSAPFKVARNDIVGRHFIATRDLHPGDVVLREAPLVTGPPLVTDCLVCVACYRVLQNDTTSFRYCPRCGWSVCSQKCADSDVHFPECQLTVSNCDGGKIDIDNLLQLHPVYHSLIILRCLLLKNSNPEAWDKLQKLESHCAKRRATGHYEKDRKTVARFLLSHFDLERDFTEEDVLRLCGVVQVNNYLVRLTEPYYLAVYDVASFIEHNCVPNCAKVFTANGELIIKIATPVSKDEHLSICYTDPSYGTRPRRAKLLEELLACRCQRCCDPTEMQSYFSALRCINRDCAGYVLPEYPILEDDNNNSDTQEDIWLCSSCDARVPGNDIMRVLDSVTQAAGQLDKTDLRACERFIANKSAAVHSNHYLLLPARLALVGRSPSGLSDKELSEIHSELSQLLELSSCILPGTQEAVAEGC
ncbi:SET domain-containing protein SmydA-8 isoform X2 [Anabrus simplex]|uniref:SET domain-containing protein SmydA-8 isoform X2 n=1 Tax=Anabrus simplex TaxID=316456 RepID=UPI0035A29B15